MSELDVVLKAQADIGDSLKDYPHKEDGWDEIRQANLSPQVKYIGDKYRQRFTLAPAPVLFSAGSNVGWPTRLHGDPRPSFDETFARIAEIIAERGTCPRLQVGAVLVNPRNQIIATGYNGAAKGMRHCSEVGCLVSPKDGSCKRAVHAEVNALVQCARNGTDPEGATLYGTHRPCVNCASFLITAGISRIVYAAPYGTDGLGDEVGQMLRDAGIQVMEWRP